MVLSAQWEPDKAGNAGQKKKKKETNKYNQSNQLWIWDINETLQIILNVNGLNISIQRHC